MTLAVLVCGWAHVLHAMCKPWGSGTVMYALQHGSLFVTSFVFLMVRFHRPLQSLQHWPLDTLALIVVSRISSSTSLIVDSVMLTV